jgi:hypothetical protein
MNKEDIKLILVIGLLSLLIGVLIGGGTSMIPEHKCIKNPLNYGISSLESGDLKVYCTCYFNNPSYSSFSFNKTGVFLLK